MITLTDLATVIRDNIHPGEEGPLTDLFLDCASAVAAAIEGHAVQEPRRTSEEQDALDAARFRFIRDNLVQRARVEPGSPYRPDLAPGSCLVTVQIKLLQAFFGSFYPAKKPDEILANVIDAMMEKSAAGSDGAPLPICTVSADRIPGHPDFVNSTLISEPKVSIPMPPGAAIPPPTRSGMSDDERELLLFMAKRIEFWTDYISSPAQQYHEGQRGELRAMINRVGP